MSLVISDELGKASGLFEKELFMEIEDLKYLVSTSYKDDKHILQSPFMRGCLLNSL